MPGRDRKGENKMKKHAQKNKKDRARDSHALYYDNGAGQAQGLNSGIFPENSNVVSATGTTGLIPGVGEDPYEMNAYQDLAGMQIPKEAPGLYDDAKGRRAKNGGRDSARLPY